MKKMILFFWACCLYTSIQATEATPVRLLIQDSLTREAVPYASIFLKTLQDSIVQAGTTDKNGICIFEEVNSDNYKLCITTVGYHPLDTLLAFNPETKQPYTLYLRFAATELADVTVRHIRKAYEQKYDRKVYTMTEAQIATARTVLDLLKTLPGVIVNDEDNSITYRGATPMMQVNDLPAGFLYPNLSVIPAEKVRKIELIDASNRGGGVLGGIINILLVKPVKEGIDGVLSSEAKQAERSHSFMQEHALNLNYGTGKNMFFGNFLYTDKYNHDLHHRTGYSLNGITGEENIIQTDTTKKHSQKFQAFLGGIRTVDSLRADFYILGIASGSEDSFYDNYTLRGTTDYLQNMTSNTHDYGIGAGYGILKRFTVPDKMLQVMTYLNVPIRFNSKVASHFSYPDASFLNIYGKGLSDRMYGMFNFYFNNPLKSGWNFSISEDSNISSSSSNSDRWRNGIVDTLNLTWDKQINWTDNLNINLGRSVNKIRLEAGISFNHSYNAHDYTRYMVMERDTNFVLRRHFFSVCPSINFNWHASETNDFSVKYAYVRKFPDINNLTDYVDKRGVYTWTTGNPDLKSAGYHTFALGHVYSKETYNFSTELIYKQSNNEIVAVGYYLPDNIRLTKPVNIGRTQELDVVFTNWLRLSSKLSMTNSATLNYKKLDQSNLKKEADAFGLDNEKFVFTQFNYNLSSYTTWSINSRNFASLRLNYYGKNLQFYGYRKPWFNSSVNYTRKMLKDDRLKLILGIDNLTSGLIDRVIVNNNMGTYTTLLEDPSVFHRTYKIAVTYIFNKGDKGTKEFKF